MTTTPPINTFWVNFPSNPKIGDLYYSNATNCMYLFDGSGFVPTTPPNGWQFAYSIIKMPHGGFKIVDNTKIVRVAKHLDNYLHGTLDFKELIDGIE